MKTISTDTAQELYLIDSMKLNNIKSILEEEKKGLIQPIKAIEIINKIINNKH